MVLAVGEEEIRAAAGSQLRSALDETSREGGACTEEDDEASEELTEIRVEDLLDRSGLAAVRANLRKHYYLTRDWSIEWYACLAYNAFISVRSEDFLVPELQRSYSVLDWGNVHMGRSLRRQVRRLAPCRFRVDSDFEGVLQGISRRHGATSWLNERYANLLRGLRERRVRCPGSDSSEIRVVSFELVDASGQLLAGEVGYCIGSVYTSLTGFSKRPEEDRERDGDRGRSFGTVQLAALAKVLERCGVAMWSLGHPPQPDGYMAYKTALGATVLHRRQFLERWDAVRDLELPPPRFGLPPGGESVADIILGSRDPSCDGRTDA